MGKNLHRETLNWLLNNSPSGKPNETVADVLEKAAVLDERAADQAGYDRASRDVVVWKRAMVRRLEIAEMAIRRGDLECATRLIQLVRREDLGDAI